MSRDARVSYARGLRGADMSAVTDRRRSLPTQTTHGPSGPSDKAFRRAVARIRKEAS